MKKYTAFLLFLVLNLPIFAQELNCQVQVNHQKIQTSNTLVFEALQKDVYDFMNNTKWTKHVFYNNERIDANLIITISEYDGNTKFSGTIQVQSRRPVFNTSYNTTIFNYKEKDGQFQFEYVQQQSLDFNENTHLSNLTSVLAFYAYIIIGLDYDTFSLQGGTPYFQQAQRIVNNAQSAAEPGWKAFESSKQDNRYFLINDILDRRYAKIRTLNYEYHRLGFDVMSEKTEQGRAKIATTLTHLREIHQNRPNSLLMNLFLIAKSDEIVKLFSGSFPEEQNRVMTIMTEVDITNAEKYQKILKE